MRLAGFVVVRRSATFILPASLLVGCASTYKPSEIHPPAPVREYRAAWVATVENIDWPPRQSSTAQQKAELVNILERAQHLKLNAVIFQVRPACDAMYESKIEPWSEFLTGTMGKAPDPFYDPLAFAIAEAHKRGLELHAWFNPYRARIAGVKTPAAEGHISNTHPKIVRHYGKQLWLDPGEKEVQDYSLSVVMDVVKRYDVDGVHFDDYFYPYKAKDSDGGELDFPDDASWQRFGAASKLNRDDWRRENVNGFIERVYKSIKAAKPWVKFGISPFGIWHDGVPAQIKGFDSYSQLYADSRKWLANGWLDYFAPQLYWAIDAPDQSFPVLLKWWCEQNSKGRHLMPGLDSTKTADSVRPTRKWKPEEIVNQIRLTRQTPGADGHIHWNMTSLMRNTPFDDALEGAVYSEPALVPASPWLGTAKLASPKITSQTRGSSRVTFNWSLNEGKASLWLVQSRTAGKWKTEVQPASQASRVWEGTAPEAIAISAVDRNGNLSAPAVLKRMD